MSSNSSGHRRRTRRRRTRHHRASVEVLYDAPTIQRGKHDAIPKSIAQDVNPVVNGHSGPTVPTAQQRGATSNGSTARRTPWSPLPADKVLVGAGVCLRDERLRVAAVGFAVFAAGVLGRRS